MRLYYFIFLMLLCSINNLLGESIPSDALDLVALTEESGVEKHLQEADLSSLDETALALHTENEASSRLLIPTRSEERSPACNGEASEYTVEEDMCDGFSIDLRNSVNPSCADNDGKFDVFIAAGTGSFSIMWSGAATGTQIQGGRWFSIKNLPAGYYTVVVTDANNCATTATITLTAPSDCQEEDICEDFSIDLRNPVNPSCADNDGKFDVFIAAGTGNFSIMWSGAATGTQIQGGRFFSVKNLPAGDYTVVVTDANNCTTSTAITLTAPSNCDDDDENDQCENFNLELRNPVNPNCADNNGKFDVVIQGGTSNFTIMWSGAATGTQVQSGRWFSVKNLPAGNYTIEVTDANDCTTSATITLTAPSNCDDEEENQCEDFSIELRNPVNPNCADNNGKFDVVIQGGRSNFTIMWSGAATGTQVQSGRWFTVKNLPAGYYTIVVTDANNCTTSTAITLTAPSDCGEEDPCENLSMELRNPVNPNCADNNGKFDVVIQGGRSNFTIMWSGAATGTQVQSGRWFSVKNLPAGNYTIEVTDANDCTITTTITLTASSDCGEEDPCENLSMELRNPVNPNCADNNGKFDVVIQGGTSNFTIMWSGAATGTQVQSGRWFSVKNLPAGYYTIEVTDANDCTITTMITLTAPSDCEEEDPCDNLSIDLRNAVDPSCDDDGKFDVFIGAGTGNFMIEWSGAATGTQIQGGRWFSVKNLPGGYYTVVVTDANNCTTTATITLAVPSDCEEEDACDNFSIDLRNAVDPSCNNDGKFDVFIAAGTGNFMIEWSGAATGTQVQGGRWFSVKNLPGGYYTVVVTDANNCTTTATITLTAPSDCSDSSEPLDGTSVRFSNINTLKAFPNPTSAKLVAAASFSELTTARLELVNAMGQTVATYEVDNIEFVQHQFDLSQQAAGVYFLKLQTATSTKIQQVVLMR